MTDRYVYALTYKSERGVGGRLDPDLDIGIRGKMNRAEPLSDAEMRAMQVALSIWEIGSRKRTGKMPDTIGEAAGFMIISEAFKDAIEDLEPGLHTFVPIDVTWTTGESAGPYYWLLSEVVVDAYDYDRTNWLTKVDGGFGRQAAQAAAFTPSLSKPKESVVRAEAVAGRHLWRSLVPEINKPYLCSEALAEFLRSRERSVLKLNRMHVDGNRSGAA